MDITCQAVFTSEADTQTVDGFCDSQDGSIFKVRFMPSRPGVYTFKINLYGKGVAAVAAGAFTAITSARKGVLRVDKQNPAHFIFDNGEHYFWNSTTAYWMLGWQDETIIEASLRRFARYGINRIRVAINGRSHGGTRWNEPTVVESQGFTLKLNPWTAQYPESLDTPKFDVGRFNLLHWQKLDRLLLSAREKGIIVSLIFYADGLDHGCDPFKKENMGNADEQRYYAYAAARYAAFSNIMWDIANEYHLFREPAWADKMGKFLKSKDPSKHLISVHGSSDFPFRLAEWVDVIMHQSWDECGGYDFIVESIKRQTATGRILPVINEEYGYEGHYPPWGCGATAAKERPDGRSGLNRSQLAWEICMAGGYQTTGETAEYGTGAGEDTGGGWINGRGNDKMIMLRYFQTMKSAFERTQYWLMRPANHLIDFGNLCLANEGSEYLIYTRVQHCRLRLPPNQHYGVRMINPETGDEAELPDADSNLDNNAWQYRQNLTQPTVFILKRK